MEGYFTEISEMLEGYKSFEKAAWSFRYDRMDVERRLENGGIVRTSDIARLMELFQVGLFFVCFLGAPNPLSFAVLIKIATFPIPDASSRRC